MQGRPKGCKNKYYSKEEKIKIVQEMLNGVKVNIKMYKKCNQLCICSETSESIFNLSFKR